MTSEVTPAVGDEVAFFLRCSPVPEYVRAWAISEIETPVWEDPRPVKTGYIEPLKPPFHGCLHLRIELDMERHHASSNVGVRMNVKRGAAPGEWLPSKPRDADAVYAKASEAHRMAERIGRARARRSPGDGDIDYAAILAGEDK